MDIILYSFFGSWWSWLGVLLDGCLLMSRKWILYNYFLIYKCDDILNTYVYYDGFDEL